WWLRQEQDDSATTRVDREDARRNHARVVDDDAVPRAQQLGELPKHVILERAAAAIDQEEPCRVALGRRGLGDCVGRQVVLEVVDVHDPAVYTGESGPVLPDVPLEPREDRAEEGVLDEPAEDLERAGLRTVER